MSFKLYSLYEIKSSIDLGELGCILRLSCGIWEIRHEQKNVFFYIYTGGPYCTDILWEGFIRSMCLRMSFFFKNYYM